MECCLLKSPRAMGWSWSHPRPHDPQTLQSLAVLSPDATNTALPRGLVSFLPLWMVDGQPAPSFPCGPLSNPDGVHGGGLHPSLRFILTVEATTLRGLS